MKFKLTQYSRKNPIPQEELNGFYIEILKMAKKRFGVDDEDDPPIQIKVVDRTRFEHLHSMPMLYQDYDGKTINSLEKRVKIASINLNIANEQNIKVCNEMVDFINSMEKKND